jgi:hypothetical protein
MISLLIPAAVFGLFLSFIGLLCWAAMWGRRYGN